MSTFTQSPMTILGWWRFRKTLDTYSIPFHLNFPATLTWLKYSPEFHIYFQLNTHINVQFPQDDKPTVFLRYSFENHLHLGILTLHLTTHRQFSPFTIDLSCNKRLHGWKRKILGSRTKPISSKRPTLSHSLAPSTRQNQLIL